MVKELILEIANKNSIKVEFIDQSKKWEDYQSPNCSWSIGSDEIWIGLYDDEEKMLISFFHELGHFCLTQGFIKSWNYNTLIIELECWKIGIDLAKEYKIFFSDNAIKWGYEQALTYCGNDERESSNWSTRVKPTLIMERQNGTL